MNKMSKNKKIVYGAIAIIILIGIIMTAALKLKFSLMYSDNTRIKVYLGKEYNINDIKQISEEVFGTKNIVYQEIEEFKESISITVKNATEEQVQNLTNKLQEKYEIETLEGLVQTSQVAHLRFRDIVKPYIMPMIIVSLIILAYVGIRYAKIGAVETVLTLLLRMIASVGLILSIIAITRIPVGAYLMPVIVGVYLIVVISSLIKFQNDIENITLEKSDK